MNQLVDSDQPWRQMEALSTIALEVRSCPRDFVADPAAGRMAVYIPRGEGGPAGLIPPAGASPRRGAGISWACRTRPS